MEQEEVDLEGWGQRMWKVVKGMSRRKKIINLFKINSAFFS